MDNFASEAIRINAEMMAIKEKLESGQIDAESALFRSVELLSELQIAISKTIIEMVTLAKSSLDEH